MSGHTHTPAEWAAFLSLGLSGAAIWSGLFLLFVEADYWAWPDPRPAVRTVGDRVLVEVVNARLAVRDAALWLVALSMLFTATPGDAR